MEDHSVVTTRTSEEAFDTAADIFAGVACEAISRHGQFTVALAGGNTPRGLYQVLASPRWVEAVPWQEAIIFFGDERDVPHDHPESNFRMAEDSLLGKVPIRLENLHAMPADMPDLDSAAGQYEQKIRDLVQPGDNGLPAFDLILLGMGADGHAASLFPDTPALDESHRLVVSQHVPVLGRHRMTFTYPLINAARCVMFLIAGMDKAVPAARVLGDEHSAASLPAGRVRPTHGKLIFVLDPMAASHLPG